MALLIVSSTFLPSKALRLNCNYSVTNSWKISSLYTCKAVVVYFGDTRAITEVSSNHMSGKWNNDVKAIVIDNQNIGFVPYNISRFFPNLESLRMHKTSISSVNRDSLRGLNRLRELYLYINNIISIPSDMFIDNPYMAYITFDNNLVKHVAPKVFDHLYYLVTLYIRSNPCLNDRSDNNRANTIWIMFRIMVYCPPTFDMIEDKLVNGNKLQGKFNLART